VTQANAEKITAAARRWLGTPYRHQASVRGRGCDCLGLIRGVWREVYGTAPQGLPAYTRDWGEAAAREYVLEAAERHLARIDPDERAAGDLVVFRWRDGAVAKHLGILSERDRFIHAWEAAGVVETALAGFWRSRIAAVFRFPEIATS
jgi:NlpC/P60 family putative phage cell wall peptidase